MKPPSDLAIAAAYVFGTIGPALDLKIERIITGSASAIITTRNGIAFRVTVAPTTSAADSTPGSAAEL